jgi:glycosyltransferase involved in cell wall biosynthesis
MSKLKVLVIGNCCLQQFPLIDYGGIESSVEHLCTGIHAHFSDKIDFTVIVPKILERKEEKEKYGFKIIDTNYIGNTYSNIHPIYFAQEIKNMIINSPNKPDVIWAQGDWSAKILGDLNIPIISTISDSGPWVEGKYFYRPNVYYRFISKFLYDFVLKDSTTNELVNKVKTQSFWLYTSLDDYEFELEENKENYILWVAGLNWGFDGKGLDDFIELSKRMPEENFVAYGTGNDEIEKQLIERVKDLPNFEFRGKLVRGDIHRDVFKKAKFFAMFTKIPEAFGRTNIEAISKGTPVLGTTHGSIPELVNHPDVGFCSNDLEQIIEVIKTRKFNYKKCFEFGKEHYHVKKEIAGLLDFTNKIIH